MSDQFAPIAKVRDLEDGQMRLVRRGFEHILLARVEGCFYALEEFCSHAGGTLSTGTLDGYEVVCPLHGARFDVRTGKQSVGPALADQPTYSVRVDGDDVLAGTMSDASGLGAAFSE